MRRYVVQLTKLAQKQVRKVPTHIRAKFQGWIEQVNTDGLPETRRSSGLNDEQLKGQLKGLRGIRLSYQWRAIY